MGCFCNLVLSVKLLKPFNLTVAPATSCTSPSIVKLAVNCCVFFSRSFFCQFVCFICTSDLSLTSSVCPVPSVLSAVCAFNRFFAVRSYMKHDSWCMLYHAGWFPACMKCNHRCHILWFYRWLAVVLCGVVNNHV